MNAQAHAVHDGFQGGNGYAPSFRFYSAAGGVEASGYFRVIDTPAGDDGQRLECSVQQAFAQAREAGLSHPVAVGVIPFDKHQSSRLFIPRIVTHLPPTAPPLAVCSLPGGKACRCIEQPGQSDFQHAVAQAVNVLRDGQIGKTVLSRLLQLDFDQPPCAETIFQGLRQQNPGAYQFFVDLPEGILVGASPELLLRKSGRRIVTNPLAGSARRLSDPDEDSRAGEELMRSSKDRHEHHLVIQELERQLRPLCSELQVPVVPSLLQTGKLWHLSTRIEGVLSGTQSALSLACHLHPTPALCGFPTQAARQLIAELEPFDRGVFGGIVGWCDAAGNGEWAVVIRCGLIGKQQVHLFAGAGVVPASCPESEWRETGTKLGTMLAAFGLDREAV